MRTFFVVLVLVSPSVTYADVNLDFSSSVPGTIADANGQGTGFTTRLPGTGSAIPADDPNLVLAPGTLSIVSPVADTQTPQNFSDMETFGVELTGIHQGNFSVSATFDVIGTYTSQLGLFAGTDSGNFVRGELHPGLRPYNPTPTLPGTDNSPTLLGTLNGVQNATNYFAQMDAGVLMGQNVTLTMGRIDNNWFLNWSDLSNPSASGGSGFLPLSSLSQSLDSTNGNLFVGIYYNRPSGNSISIPETTYVQSFSATTNQIPEPSTFAIAVIGCCFAVACTIRRKIARP
jgi:hypothetical protein